MQQQRPCSRFRLNTNKRAYQSEITASYTSIYLLIPQTLTLTLYCLNCLRHTRGKTGGRVGIPVIFCTMRYLSTLSPEAVECCSTFQQVSPSTSAHTCLFQPRNSALQQCASLRGGQPCDLRNYSTYGDAWVKIADLSSSPSTVDQAVWGGFPWISLILECLQLFIMQDYVTERIAL